MNHPSRELLFFLFVFIGSLGSLTAADNYFENPDFEGGLERWHVSCGAGSFEVKPEGPDGAASLTFTMAAEGKRRFTFYQDTDLSLTEKYRVSFLARSDQKVGILLAPQRREGDYGAIGGGSTATLGPEWKEYHLNIKIDSATSNGRLTFLSIDPVPEGTIQFARFQLETVE